MTQPPEESKGLLRPSAGQTKMVEAKKKRLHWRYRFSYEAAWRALYRALKKLVNCGGRGFAGYSVYLGQLARINNELHNSG